MTPKLDKQKQWEPIPLYRDLPSLPPFPPGHEPKAPVPVESPRGSVILNRWGDDDEENGIVTFDM